MTTSSDYSPEELDDEVFTGWAGVLDACDIAVSTAGGLSKFTVMESLAKLVL